MPKKTLDVVAIGSCYVDINSSGYPFGKNGIPAEVELVGGSYKAEAGGSAVNFCRLLGRLGLRPAFMGMVGHDAHGRLLRSLLKQQGTDARLIGRAGLQTNISFNMTNPAGQHIMLVTGTANPALSPAVVLPKLAGVLPIAKMLYLGGCFKLKTFAPSFIQLASQAAACGAALVVDHNRVPQAVAPGMLAAVKALVLRADYYLPSHGEFCQVWRVPTIQAGLLQLHHQAPRLTAVVKDGANGAYYVERGAVVHVPALPVAKVVNATGAGDTFNAGLVAGLAKGYPLSQAVPFACQVAAAKIAGHPLPSLADI